MHAACRLLRHVAVVCALATFGWSYAAPAPRPRPVATPTLEPGVFALKWGHDDWMMHLAPSGRYRCVRGDAEWVGEWRVEKGVLLIEERRDGLSLWSWSFDLRQGLSGDAKRHSSVVTITLVRQPVDPEPTAWYYVD